MLKITYNDKKSNMLHRLIKWQYSAYYPAFFSLLCVIAGLGNKYVYLPILSLMGICVLFSVFFVPNKKVLIVPIFMMYYALGTDTKNAFIDTSGDVLASFDNDGFIGICIIGTVIVIPLITRLIKDGDILAPFKSRDRGLFGILILSATILLGGAFSSGWSFKNLVHGILICMGLIVFYIIFHSIITSNTTDEIIPYMCRAMLFTCLAISAQVAYTAISAHMVDNFIIYSSTWNRWIINRELFSFAWGLPTIVGAVSVLGIPSALYLARKERFPIFYYASAVVLWLVSVAVNTRSALFVGSFILFIGAFIISFSGKNKRSNLIFSVILVLASFAGGYFLYCKLLNKFTTNEILFNELYKFFRFDSINDRIKIFSVGFEHFLSHPIFGIGWDIGAYSEDIAKNNFFSNMYHCLPIQIGASTGVIGLIALLIHLKDIVCIAFKKVSIDKIFLVSVPIMILLMSLVDNFFFYLNFQILYTAFLVLASRETTKNK